MDLIRIVSVAGSVAILALVLQLVRKGKLRERYALLWLATGLVLLLFSIWRELLHILAGWFGVYYPPSFIFLVFLVFMSLIALHLTVVVSTLADRTKRLTQELALLKQEFERDPGD